MRIAIISPYSNGPMRGNIITVRRIADFLGQAGITTLILAVDRFTVNEMYRRLTEFEPDVIHGFHAHICGEIAMQLALQMQIPYLITITGSDLHDSLLRDHPGTVRAIETAQAIACFHVGDSAKLMGFFPSLRGKVSVVPQGVEPLLIVEDNFELAPESFVLLLPAALRPVKQIEFSIRALSKLAAGDKTLYLVITGGVIDTEYAAVIRTMLSDAPFATWLGEVPHERMGALYQRADLVLNCSHSESMPNSLLEGLAIGRPVLAADISGNRSLIQHGKNGWLYDGEADFMRMVLHIKEHGKLREEVGRNAKEQIMIYHSPQIEAKRYATLYRELIAA